MRLYQRARRNRLLIGSNLGLVGGGGGGGAVLPPFEQPYILNFEGDTIGETAFDLEAKATHEDPWNNTAEVEAIDNLTFNTCSENYTQCLAELATSVGEAVKLPSGSGFTPTGGSVVLVEGVLAGSGIGSAVNVYMMDAAFQEGILFGWADNGVTFLDTRTGGSGTRKLNSTMSMTATPFSSLDWFYFGLQYDQSSRHVYSRCKVLGSVNTEDTGWVHQGQLSNPTYNTSAEWRWFQAYANAQGATGRKGLAQLRVCEQTEHGYGLGVLETHNYRELP